MFLLKKLLLYLVLFISSISYGQDDSSLFEFDRIAILPQTKLVVLAKVLSFKIDTIFSYHYDDSNMVYNDTDIYAKDSNAKIPDTIIQKLHKSMSIEIIKIFKGNEEKKIITVWLNDGAWFNSERLSYYSFELGINYYMVLCGSGLENYESDTYYYEPRRDYTIYNHSFRCLKLVQNNVQYLSGDNVRIRNKIVNDNLFNIHIEKYIANESYRKKHYITNILRNDEIWLKLGVNWLSNDTNGIFINNKYYNFNENYTRYKIKGDSWNIVDGGLVKLLPKKKYVSIIYSCSGRRGFYCQDTNIHMGLGCYRFRFKNAPPDFVSIYQSRHFRLSTKDTDYLFPVASGNCYYDLKSIYIENTNEDTSFAIIHIYFYLNEMVTITYDFNTHTYKVDFDGFLDKILEASLKYTCRNKKLPTNDKYNRERKRIRYKY